MQYVVTVHYTEGEGPDLHNIIGPFDTMDEAENARIEFVHRMDDVLGDWSQVYVTDVKGIHTASEAETYQRSLFNIYTRCDKWARGLDNYMNLDEDIWK